MLLHFTQYVSLKLKSGFFKLDTHKNCVFLSLRIYIETEHEQSSATFSRPPLCICNPDDGIHNVEPPPLGENIEETIQFVYDLPLRQ